jgi:G:T-mismatch repair DNA endonuclease (very short patch repair protein)
MRKAWKKEDEERLIYLYEKKGLSLSELISTFYRTKGAIQNKINKLKLRHTSEQTALIKNRLHSGKNNGMYGKESPNKGKTKENSERIRKAAVKLSTTRKLLIETGVIKRPIGKNNPQYGKHSWSFGLTKNSSEALKKSGRKQSATRKKRWLQLSEDQKSVIRKRMAHIGATCKKRRTKIEIIMAGILDSLHLNYKWGHEKDNFVFDFFLLDKNFVIECQGDYWHANPKKYNELNLNEIQKKNIKRDQRKKKYLKDHNIPSLFFWEDDIKYNLKNVINEIKAKIT